MIDRLLLLISDRNLRQLYHELLFSLQIEIVPVESISAALLMLTLENYTHAVLLVDERNSDEIIVFLALRQQQAQWQRIRFFIISFDERIRTAPLEPFDMVIEGENKNPEEVSALICSFVHKL